MEEEAGIRPHPHQVRKSRQTLIKPVVSDMEASTISLNDSPSAEVVVLIVYTRNYSLHLNSIIFQITP